MLLDFNNVTQSVTKTRDEANLKDRGDFIDHLRMMMHKIRATGKTMLDQLNEELVIANGIGFFGGGFESTSTTMSALIYSFAKYPEIQQKCYEDIEEVLTNTEDINHETITRMHYLEACIQVFIH